MNQIMERNAPIDRRKLCALRLDKRSAIKNVIYEDSPSPESGLNRGCWVARLSQGTVIVTRR